MGSRREAIVVLGMHRSGTSSLTGVMGLLGATMPQTLMPPGVDNPRGFWEPLPIAALNDEILEGLESSWFDWRPLPVDRLSGPAAAAYQDRAIALLGSEFGDAPLIALKDPRMTRLFPFWREILAEAGYRIGVTIPLRHPLEVAASLRARNAMPVAQGLLMWLGGMLDAELQSRGYPRRLLPWADFLRDWRPVLDAAAQSLEIAWPISPDEARSRINTFLDAGLRHQVLREEDLRAEPAANTWIRDVYAAMTHLVSDPGSVEAMTELDRVRLEFTDATRLFGPNLDRLEQHGKQVATGAEALRAAVADREAKLAVAQAESDVTSARVAELEQRLSRAHDDVERLTAATAEQARQAGELASALSDSEAGRARGESRAAVSEARVRELEAHAAAREAIVADLRGQLDRPWRTALRLTLPARALAVVRWIRHR